ncbi:hypothetical protein EDB81DRAFT_671874, partial [Dactylonectria macrodidyma]
KEHNALYNTSLRQLHKALKAKYNLNNISYISYTLAVNVYYTIVRTYLGEGAGLIVCLLTNHNRVASEFYRSNYTFYPLSFHPAYRNFSSDRLPAFLDSNLFTIIKENISY